MNLKTTPPPLPPSPDDWMRCLRLETADSPQALGQSRARLAGLARRLREHGAQALDIADLISRAVRIMTARSAKLAEEAMRADGWGGAPAPFALLVLGSAGRGESLLAFDQDNAIVQAGEERDDPWFAELGRRLNDILAEAGLPYCNGEVMARNPAWRRSLAGWQDEIARWVFEPAPETLMNVDIFFDFETVAGADALASELRRHAVQTVAQSAFFLRYLTLNAAKAEVPLTLFGGFATTDGRFNIKKAGLLPVVGIARARALGAGIDATATAERYRALARAGQMSETDLASILDAHRILLDITLDQQLADLAQGRPPSALVAPASLTRADRRRLKDSLLRIRALVAVAGGL